APGVQWIGDRSYSVYLWHWPLLLAASTLFERRIVATVGADLITLVLSELTYRHVEQRFRFRVRSPRATSRRRPTRAVGVLVVATMVTGAGGLLLTVPRDDGTLTPSLAEATDDRFMEFYDGDCRPDIPESDPLT